MLPGMLGLHDGLGSGCNYYRMQKPYAALRKAGYPADELSMQSQTEENQQNWLTTSNGFKVPPDFQRHHHITTILRPLILGYQKESDALAHADQIREIIETAHSVGTVVGGDIDDDMWTLGDDNPAKSIIGEATPELMRTTFQQMDFATVSTQFLKERLITETGMPEGMVRVVPNLIEFTAFDSDNWLLEVPAADQDNIPDRLKSSLVTGKDGKLYVRQDMKRHRFNRLCQPFPEGQRPVFVGLQGGHSHYEDWKLVANALQTIYNRYGERVRFIVAGFHPDYLQEALSDATSKGHVTWLGWKPFDRHAETVMTFDINLCPLRDTVFNRSKSNIKFLEGAAAGAASVVSPTVYGLTVQNGLTGYIAEDESDWVDAISDLIENHSIRQTLGQMAHQLSRQEFNLETGYVKWASTLIGLWQAARPKVKAAMEKRSSVAVA